MAVGKNRKESRERFWRTLLVLLIAALLSAASFSQYKGVLEEVSDIAATDLYSRLLHPFGQTNAASSVAIRVALYRTADENTGAEGQHQGVSGWQRFLSRNKLVFDIVRKMDSPDALARYNVLILPSASVLSRTETETVKRYLERGGGLLMSWAVGTRDDIGGWRKLALMQEIGGIEFTGRAGVFGTNLCEFAIVAPTPVSAGLHPGLTVKVAAYDQPLYARVVESRSRVAAAWRTDAAESLSTPTDKKRDQAAIIQGSYLDGRFVWLGFEPSAVQAEGEVSEQFTRLVINSIVWASRQAQVSKLLWPEPYLAAMTMTASVNNESDLAAALQSAGQGGRIPVTWFLGTAFATNGNGAIRRLLGDKARVGLLLTANELAASPQPLLSGLREKLSTMCGAPITGARIEGSLDQTHLDKLLRAGFQYVVARPIDRLVPHIVRTYQRVPFLSAQHYLWLIPEMESLTAFTHGASGGAEDGSSTPYELNVAIHGLGCCTVSAAELGMMAGSGLSELAGAARRDGVWLAPLDVIRAGWERLDSVKVSSMSLTGGKTLLTISNRGKNDAEDYIMDVTIARPVASIKVKPLSLDAPDIDVRFVNPTQWRITLKRLEPGHDVAYHIETQDRGT